MLEGGKPQEVEQEVEQQQPALVQQSNAGTSSCEGQQQCSEGVCGSGGGGGGDGAAPAAVAAAGAPPPGTVCMKCRKAEAQVVARGREPLCYPCLHEQLLSKVRNAVRLHALIQPGDSLALAFSGGPGAAVLLRFLAELRNPRTDRPARGKVSFTLHIVHVDESTALGLGPEEAAARRASTAAAAAQYCQEGSEGTLAVQFHCVPLEAVFEGEEEAAGAAEGAAAAANGTSSSSSSFSSSSSSLLEALAGSTMHEWQRQRLRALLGGVRDVTGRHDLACHLRARLLLRCAAVLGCRRMARGDCATALAAHIVAAASKGCGYSLPGDVQLFDARHGGALPAVFLPLREVSARELRAVCSHWRLPLAEGEGALLEGGAAAAAAADKKNINSLAAAFIAGMEMHNPGSVPNILNTISKLQAFPWNEAPLTGQQLQQLQREHAQQAQQSQGQQPGLPGTQQEQQEKEQLQMAPILCPICLAPLADDELPGSRPGVSSSSNSSRNEHTTGGTGVAAAASAAGCCLSCYAQILGDSHGAGSGSGTVNAALPAAVQRQMVALVAAGYTAAAAAAAGARQPDGSGSDGSGVERLRAQIAEFLLE